MFVKFCGLASVLLILVPCFKGALGTVTRTYGLALDVKVELSTDAISCLKNASYAITFVEVYSPENGGQPNGNAKNSIVNAHNAKVGVEIYVQPNVSFATAKTPEQQFDAMKKHLQDNRISFGAVWLVVSQPTSWSNNTQTNIQFINSYLGKARAAKHYVGIRTSWYDWYLITNQYAGVQNNGSVMLWYWNTLGIGPTAVTDRDFSDFRQFGGWRSPTVKQYGIVEEVCGVPVNRDTFVNGTTSTSSSKKALAHSRLTFKPNRLDKLVRKVNPDGSVELSATVGHNFYPA